MARSTTDSISTTMPAAAPIPRQARHCPRSWLVLLLVCVVGVGADLSTKTWAFSDAVDEPVVLDRDDVLNDPEHDPTRHHDARPLLGDVLGVRLALNRGAVFGLGNNGRTFFVIFTFGALAAGVALFMLRTRSHHGLAQIGIALALAGGIGNLYDRLRFGVVRDFLQFMPGERLPNGWTWPGTSNPELTPWVFNIADVFLFVGLALVLLHLRELRRDDANTSPATMTPEPAGA